VTLEEAQVQSPLVVEVAIDDRLRDPGGRRDVVEPGVVVTALAEQRSGGLDDQSAPFGYRQALAGSLRFGLGGHSYRRVT
jgi:hypothetical protein